MAMIKCKMCGGDLVLTEGSSVAECEYCGSRQTVPLADNEKKLTFFTRAGQLRRTCEFDKAAGIYEAIVAEFPLEAEAYWGLLLCKYGIEYVDDPATGKKIPTCHRSSFASVMEDPNFVLALENADEVAVRVYRQEAKQIERIRRGILEVSSNEKPYDIFICYKETDSNGDRTVDSLLAQDIYNALNAQGYRVFFSRITLEGKLGQAYEPYIFAALNSAKIMLAVGTSYENYHAVWVKNEWSRYIKIVSADPTKYLIPCYKGLDPSEDLPREFAHLQGQDMGKVGAIADLLRGIEKLLPPVEKAVESSFTGNNKIAALLERGSMALEDGDWTEAYRFFEEVLNNAPREAQAYLGKLLAEFHLSKAENLSNCTADFTASSNYQKALRFGDDKIQTALESARKDKIYYAAKKLLEEKTKASCQAAAIQLAEISGWRDADNLLKNCQSRIAEFSGKKTTKRKKTQNKSMVLVASIAAILAVAVISAALLRKPAVQPETDIMVESEQLEQIPATETTEFLSPEAIAYAEAEKLLGDGESAKAAIAFGKLADYADSRERSFAIWETIVYRETIPTDWTKHDNHWDKVFVALKNDGTVVTTFPGVNAVLEWTDIVAVECGTYPQGSFVMGLKKDGSVVTTVADDYLELDTSKWSDIVAIDVRGSTAVGLKADGTVVATGNDSYGQCNVKAWTDIVSVSTTGSCTIGVRVDGSVVACGNGATNVSDWKDIASISTSGSTIGIKTDGTIETTNTDLAGDWDVSGWRDIIAADTAYWGAHIVGLRSDGTVVATGLDNQYNKIQVDDWTDIVEVYTTDKYTVGLKSDGTVISTGLNIDGCLNVEKWTDIVAIRPWYGCTVGLKSDGTVVYAGKGHKDIQTWTDIKVPVTSQIPINKQDTTNQVTGTVNVKGLNVRSEPTNSSKVVAQYQVDDTVIILEHSDGWGRTDKGWIDLQYVSLE